MNTKNFYEALEKSKIELRKKLIYIYFYINNKEIYKSTNKLVIQYFKTLKNESNNNYITALNILYIQYFLVDPDLISKLKLINYLDYKSPNNITFSMAELNILYKTLYQYKNTNLISFNIIET